MSASTYLEDAWASTLRGGGNGVGFAAPAAVYGQLHTGDPGEDGTANVAGETSRQEVQFGPAVGGLLTLSNTPSWVNVAATETYRYLSLWDSPAGGNCLGASEPMAPPQSISAGDRFDLTVCTWRNE